MKRFTQSQEASTPTLSSMKGILTVVEDSLNLDYPELSVRALFDDCVREKLRHQLLRDHKRLLNDTNSKQVLAELVGLGFFEDLFKDESITDIGWNGTDLWVKTHESKRKINHPDINERYVLKIIQRFSNYVHQEFSEKSPILNAQLDNIRINAVHRTLSPTGTTMSMRHARKRLVLTQENWSNFADNAVYHLLHQLVLIGSNVVITGEVGTGKTELQKLLIGSIPDSHKVIMIEDTLETHLKTIYPQKDIISWLVGPGNTHSQFIKEALRNDPVYTVLSEARDHAIYEIHQSILSGHKIILTLHAINAHALCSRMIGMIKQKYMIDEASFIKEVLQYYDIGIHLEKREIHGKTIRFIQEVVAYTNTGIQSLYTRNLFEKEDATTTIEEQFNPLPESLLARLKKYGLHVEWKG